MPRCWQSKLDRDREAHYRDIESFEIERERLATEEIELQGFQSPRARAASRGSRRAVGVRAAAGSMVRSNRPPGAA